MNDVQELQANCADELSLEKRIEMLNVDQARVFKRISEHLLHQQRHESGVCECSQLQPLHMFVSGVGGTGKSFLIEAMRAQVAAIWKDKHEALLCAVAAPTGLAAFNVGGVTVHRLFQLPIEHERKEAGYWGLPRDSLKIMRTTLRDVKLFVIDEVSMLSSLNLAYLHLRLEEVFGTDNWFGSISILFVGDLLQLPPVNGAPVFDKLNTKAVLSKLGCMTSVNIWKETIVYNELTINERQKKDPQFCVLLDEVRRGCVSEECIRILEERVIQGPIADRFEELMQSGQSPVCLFSTRKACEEFNSKMLSKLQCKTVEICCTDEVDETKGMHKWSKKEAEELKRLNKDCNLTAGLEAMLHIGVGARVMLRRNTNTSLGLVNGALGTVVAIGAHKVTVKFDHMSTEYEVEKVKSRFIVMRRVYVYRVQSPLIFAYAVTIHKCQFLSLDCAMMDLSDQVFSSGMAYVALSRVRTLDGVHLVAFDQKSIMVSSKSLQEINRLRQLHRSDLMVYALPHEQSANRKRKLRGTCMILPDPKKQKEHLKEKM